MNNTLNNMQIVDMSNTLFLISSHPSEGTTWADLQFYNNGEGL